jgi:ABC-type dipeptide/oligopeptide/nickel transport system ATPase component
MKPEFLGDSKSVKGQIASGNKTTTDIIIQEIAAIFQIPTAMLTNLQQVSGGVIERVDAQHLQQCIIPRWNAVEERLNRTVMLLWSKDGFRLVADDEPSNPHVDQANAKEWLTANIIDRNEARELVGFHKTSEQDELPAQLSGAQLDSMSQIALNASQGFIPRESAIGQLMVGLGFTRQEAEQILGPIGQSNYQPVDMNGGK